MNTPLMVSWATSHPGARRRYNQDSFVDRADVGLWAVADGAGGHQGGELASGMLRAALEAIPAGLPAAELLGQVRRAVTVTHEALRGQAAEGGVPLAGASTIVALVVGGGHYACLWAGDSRGYLLRGGVLVPITHDHSLVQELVDAGVIAPEDADAHPQGNVITRAVGAEMDDFVLDLATARIEPGDRFLLCSDGLHKCVPEAEIAGLLTEASPAEALLAAALRLRASDNVTAVAVACQ
jgi:serine/threonine protein phosphatase PrpC